MPDHDRAPISILDSAGSDRGAIALPVERGAIGALISRCGTSTYRQGQTLFYEGHVPTGLYVLVGGRVVFSGVPREEGDGKSVSGTAVLGLESLLNDTAYPATARALEDCEVAFVDKTLFQEFASRADSPIRGLLPARSAGWTFPAIAPWWPAAGVRRLCMAGGVALLILGVVGIRLTQGRGREFPIAAAVAEDHEPFAAGRFRLDIEASDSAIAADWFKDKLGVPLSIPPRIRQVRLAGARLCWFKGKDPVAYFMGHLDKHALSLFAFDSRHFRPPKGDKLVLKGREFRVAQQGRYEAVSWKTGHTGYLLLSDVGAADLLALASNPQPL